HIVYHELYKKWLEEHPDEPVPDYFVSADQLTPEEHVRMQAVIQQYVDASISKTVNAPRHHTVDQVRTLYRLAYELGCKGITYYRDGSREGVLHKLDDGDRGKQGTGFSGEAAGQAGQAGAAGAATGASPAAAVAGDTGGLKVTWGRIRPIERPSKLNGFTVRRTTPLGNLYLTLNTFNGHPFELFTQIGKAGSDVAAFTEAIARLVSLAFRSGIDPHEVVEQLRGIGGSRSVGFGPNRVLSVPDAIAQFLDDYLSGKIERDPVDEVAAGQLTVFPTDPAQQAREAVAAARGAAGTVGHGEFGSAAGGTTGATGTAGYPAGGSGPVQLTIGGMPQTGEPPRITGGNGRQLSMNLCPECGSHALVHEEGCSKCLACGYSEC
ncbi:MAG TPA: ribonucleoside-diphosphate reductase, adenosylcobalamin-dependent, partial [Thermaerobacter sp.]